MMDSDHIHIRGLQVRCHIGVPAEERRERQTLRVHLTLAVPPFPTDDSLDGTVDYQVVADEVQVLAMARERKLIETLALEIADHILGKFPVNAIKVEIEKKILPETDWVGVTIERKRI